MYWTAPEELTAEERIAQQGGLIELSSFWLAFYYFVILAHIGKVIEIEEKRVITNFVLPDD